MGGFFKQLTNNKMVVKTLDEEIELIVKYYAPKEKQDQLKTAIQTLIKKHNK